MFEPLGARNADVAAPGWFIERTNRNNSLVATTQHVDSIFPISGSSYHELQAPEA